MSGTGPEALHDIVSGICDDIAPLEERLGATVDQLNSMLVMVGNARSGIEGTIEEHNLERSSVQPDGICLADDDEDADLRARGEELAAMYSRVSAIYQQLNGFVHVPTSADAAAQKRSIASNRR